MGNLLKFATFDVSPGLYDYVIVFFRVWLPCLLSQRLVREPGSTVVSHGGTVVDHSADASGSAGESIVLMVVLLVVVLMVVLMVV